MFYPSRHTNKSVGKWPGVNKHGVLFNFGNKMLFLRSPIFPGEKKTYFRSIATK